MALGNPTHPQLPTGKQYKQDQRGGLLGRQRRLAFHPPLELFLHALKGVGGAQGLVLAGREATKRQQLFAGLFPGARYRPAARRPPSQEGDSRLPRQKLRSFIAALRPPLGALVLLARDYRPTPGWCSIPKRWPVGKG